MLNLSPEFKEELKKSFLIQQIIWFALTGSVFVYWFVAQEKSVQEDVSQGNTDVSQIKLILSLISALAVVAIFAGRKFFSLEKQAERILNGSFDREGSILKLCQSKYGVSQECVERRSKYSDLEIKILKFMGFSFVYLIISLALSESIVIYGLVLVTLGENMEALYPFALTTLCINAFLFPRLDNLLNIAERANRNF